MKDQIRKLTEELSKDQSIISNFKKLKVENTTLKTIFENLKADFDTLIK